jgi:tetratricopeptide (TPR) repeat protein
VRCSFGIWLAIVVSLWPIVGQAEPAKPSSDRAPSVPLVNEPAETPQTDPAAALDLDNAAEPFVPARSRSEAEDDRIEALSLFAAARIDEQEDRLYRALRRYQRAARFDPSSQAARRQAVVLAIRLGDADSPQQEKEGHWNAALRYAAKGDLGIDEAGVLRELARHFAQREQYAEALRFFRESRALQEKQSTGYVILSLDVGRMAYLTGEYAAAADAFAEVIKALEHPDQFGLDERLQRRLVAGRDGTANVTQLNVLFAEAFLSAERFDQATAAFEKANRATPNSAAHAFRLARIADARKEPAKALETLQPYFEAKQTSEGLAPYQLLVKLLNDVGREKEVISTFAAMHDRDGENQPLTLFLAEQYRAAEQFDKAEPLYAAALAKNPSALAYHGLAAAQRRLKHTANLLDLLGDVAGKTGSLDLLGDELQAIAADTELVGSLVQLARDRHTADPDSVGFGQRLALAIVALDAERFDDAREVFELAMKGNHERAAGVYRVWGIGLLMKERYADAAAVFQRAIDERAVGSTDPNFHYLLSKALLADGKTDDAIEAAKHVVSLAPRHVEAARWLAQIFTFAKRYDETATVCEDMIRRFDEDEQSDESRQQLRHVRLLMSNVAVIKHDTAAAEEWLAQVLDEFPDDIGAQNDLGYLWADEGKHLKLAQGMIERAVAAEPENAAYRDSLGWILYRLGRYEDAVAELKKAAIGPEPDGVMMEHLGDACLAAGQQEAAGEAWQKARAAFEKEGDAEKIDRIKQKLADLPQKK